MRQRGRALAFLFAAGLAAAAAAALADRYREGVAGGFGPLRPVVVVRADLAAGSAIGAREAAARLATRRVPVRFAPPDALASPAAALGLETRSALPAGSYLLASQLRPPRRRGRPARRLAGGRKPVEIAVGGAGALLAAGGAGGGRVDVVVTTEPGSGGRGRTFVAAAAVPLLALRPAGAAEGAGAAATTLALTRRQALRLIAAESYARKITLIPVG